MEWLKKIIKMQTFWLIIFEIALFIWGKILNDSVAMKISIFWLCVEIYALIKDLKKHPH